jgi:hypothetical protein
MSMSTTITTVRERPILFSAPMVRAILDGRKTQTRRIVKPQPPAMFSEGDVAAITNGARWAFSRVYSPGRGVAFPADPEPGFRCPYGLPGDRLWVREAWQITGRLGTEYAVWYPAGGEAVGIDVGFEGPSPKWDAMIHDDRVRPSIHMPRWASRITLEVTGVRIERLQDISEADARAEGVVDTLAFEELWDSINGSGAWDANPWCWCISFKRVESSR